MQDSVQCKYAQWKTFYTTNVCQIVDIEQLSVYKECMSVQCTNVQRNNNRREGEGCTRPTPGNVGLIRVFFTISSSWSTKLLTCQFLRSLGSCCGLRQGSWDSWSPYCTWSICVLTVHLWRLCRSACCLLLLHPAPKLCKGYPDLRTQRWWQYHDAYNDNSDRLRKKLKAVTMIALW